MRRIGIVALLVAMAFTQVGCIIVAARTSPGRRQVVAMDGKLYMVDTESKTAQPIDDEDVVRIEITDGEIVEVDAD